MRGELRIFAAHPKRVLLCIIPLILVWLMPSCRNFDGTIHNDSTITLQQGMNGYVGTIDCHILEWGPDNNTGGNSVFEVCRFPQNQQNDDKYGLIRFDLSSIPGDVEILHAELQVYFTSVRNGTAAKVLNCHMVVGSWAEGNEVGIDGQIGPGTTWNSKPVYITTLLDSQIMGASTNSWQSFDITSAVGMWVGGSVQNYGVLLKPEMSDDFPVNAPGTKQFASSEHTTISIRPRLTVTYREVIFVE
jgi:hypothetical protein